MTEQKHTHEPMNVDEALITSEAFLIKYKNVMLGAVVALIVIVGGYLGYKHFISDPKEAKASEAIFKGEQYFGASNYEAALNGDSLGYADLSNWPTNSAEQMPEIWQMHTPEFAMPS